MLLVANTESLNAVRDHQLQPIKMGARPDYTAPYMPHLLERNATIEDAAKAYLEERHLSCEDDRYHNDQYLTPLHYGDTYHNDDLRRAVPAPPSQHRVMYPPLQHHYDDLKLLELGRHGRFPEPSPTPHDAADEELEFGGRGRRRFRDPLQHGAASEKLMFDRRGHCPNRDPLPYGIADVGLESCLRGRLPNRISPPYDTAYDRFIPDDARRGRVHRYSFGIDWPPFASSSAGIDDFNGGSMRQIYLGPLNRHSRSRLREDHDLGSGHLGILEPHSRHHQGPRLDEYISDYDRAMRGPHYDLGGAGMPPAARYSAGHPFEANLENYASETKFRKAHARQPHPTKHRSNLDFPSIHQDVWNPTAAELRGLSYHVKRHDKLPDEERLQELRKSWNEAGSSGREPAIDHSRPVRRHRRRQSSRATRSRPAASLSDRDLEGSPRSRRNRPFRAHHSRNRTHSPRIQRTSPPIAADPTAKGAGSNAPHAQQHTQGPIGHLKKKDAARNNGTGPRNSSSKPGITPTPERAARETPSTITHKSQAGLGDNDRSESSSDSGCYTPDADSDGAIGGGGDKIREGDVLHSFLHIEL